MISDEDKIKVPPRQPGPAGIGNVGRQIKLWANHFPVKFTKTNIMLFQYDITIEDVDLDSDSKDTNAAPPSKSSNLQKSIVGLPETQPDTQNKPSAQGQTDPSTVTKKPRRKRGKNKGKRGGGEAADDSDEDGAAGGKCQVSTGDTEATAPVETPVASSETKQPMEEAAEGGEQAEGTSTGKRKRRRGKRGGGGDKGSSGGAGEGGEAAVEGSSGIAGGGNRQPEQPLVPVKEKGKSNSTGVANRISKNKLRLIFQQFSEIPVSKI